MTTAPYHQAQRLLNAIEPARRPLVLGYYEGIASRFVAEAEYRDVITATQLERLLDTVRPPEQWLAIRWRLPDPRSLTPDP